MLVLDSPCKLLQFSLGATTFGCPGVTLADTGNGCWKFRQLKRLNISKRWFVITWSVHRRSVCTSWGVFDVSVKQCSFGVFATFGVCPARGVGREWSGNSWTDSPSNRFYVSLAIRMFSHPLIKTVRFSAFWELRHCWWFKILRQPFLVMI